MRPSGAELLRMTLRHARPDEAEAILRFWVDSGASLSTTDQVDFLRKTLHHPAAVLVLALVDDAIVGTVLGTFDGWRGNIYRLVVAPDRRRQGIGRQPVGPSREYGGDHAGLTRRAEGTAA